MNLLETLKRRRLYFDGGTGTLLQDRGLAPGQFPETWNLSHPEEVSALHRAYRAAGADLLKANTFGLCGDRIGRPEDLAEAGLGLCRDAAGKDAFVAYDMGPLGRLLRPLGDLDFEDAVAYFARGARWAERYGADLVLIETMTDARETKAALLAVRENCSLPVFVTNAYDGSGKLTTGGDPRAMIAMLEGLHADAIGVNCSLGPQALLPLVRQYTEFSSLPVVVNPNAGLPVVRDGRTVYDTDAETFSRVMAEMAEFGAAVLGGCCGTTPEYIRLTREKTASLPYVCPTEKTDTVVSSYTHGVVLGREPVLIGERINPTGKKKIKEALRARQDDAILSEGLRQADAGVQMLDVNAGLPEIDEAETLERLVTGLQAVTDLPLQIDSSSPQALARAMRVYCGKPLVNSVNGTRASMDAVFPLVQKYGGTVIALTMDESGIPPTAEGRLAVAEKIICEAARWGIAKRDIVVDPLTLTVSSEPDAATVTLDAVQLIRERLGVCTSLGVSNVSFGLPGRDAVNAAFFAMALDRGLSAAIMNPFSHPMMETYHAFRALHGLDKGCLSYVAFAAAEAEPAAAAAPADMTLGDAILRGLSGAAREKTASLLQDTPPLSLIEEQIVPALNEIGQRFEAKKAFLPQLLMSADAASAAFEVIGKVLPPKSDGSRRIVLATVQGDMHDIGKNIVRVLLENFGFTVEDLGRDVPPARVAEAARGCRLAGLSALMTTTVPAMEETIRQIRACSPETKIVVGGAVLTQEYAMQIGADFYAANAMETVRIAQQIFEKGL